jgi:dTMP kinase
METLPNFIVFEGLDGSGQSTQASLLAKYLEANGRKVLVTKEPTNNLIGGLIRGALTHEWSPSNHVIQLLLAADRGHHLEREILPALSKGYTVICDRYLFSSLAFGSITDDSEYLKVVNSKYPLPEHIFYIQTTPKISLQRIHSNRFEIGLFEEEAKLEKVATAYQRILTDFSGVHVINGEQSIEEVHQAVLTALTT